MPAYLFTIRQNRADIIIISLISSKMADIMVYNAVECCNTMAAKTKALPNAGLLFVIPVGEATAAVIYKKPRELLADNRYTDSLF